MQVISYKPILKFYPFSSTLHWESFGQACILYRFWWKGLHVDAEKNIIHSKDIYVRVKQKHPVSILFKSGRLFTKNQGLSIRNIII